MGYPRRLQKKNIGTSSHDFGMGYQPTPQDIKTKQDWQDFQSGLEKSPNGSKSSQSTKYNPTDQTVKRDNTTNVRQPIKPYPKGEQEKENYYNPDNPSKYSSGDKRIDFVYKHPWLINTPIIGDKIKSEAYEIAKRSNGASDVENVDSVRKQSPNYKGNALMGDNDTPKVNLIDQYFGKISLPASKYKPTSDYMEFLPSVSIKGPFDQKHKNGYDMTDMIKDVVGKSTGIDYTKPIYKQNSSDSKVAEELGVDLGGHKTGIGYDKERKLPYVSISDAWDFEPNAYAGKHGGDDGGRKYVEAYLMHHAGTPFKVYDRLYFDPNTKQYIPDDKLTKSSKDEQPKLPILSTKEQQEIIDKTNSVSPNKNLQNYWNSLKPEEKFALNKSTQQIQQEQSNQDIHATPKAEQEAYAYSQTPVGKLVNGTKYLAQKATKGSLQVVKGAAYLADLGLNTQRGIINGDNPNTQKEFAKADKATDFLSKGDQSRVEDSKVMTNLGGLAEFLPAAAAAEGTGGATLYLQGMGSGKETIDAAEKNGAKINPVVKNAFILGSGAVNGFLMGETGSTIFKSMGTSLKNDVVAEITTNAIKEAAGKELTAEGFNDLLKQGAKTWQDKTLQAGVNYLENTKHAITNLAALNVADFALKKGVDATTDKPVFNETPGDLADQLGNTIKAGAAFGAAGSLGDATKLTPFSQYKNAVVESLLHDSSDENVAKTKQFIDQHGTEQGWAPEEIKATNDHVDELAKVTKTLPKGLPPDKAEKATELVIGRNDLQKQLTDLQEQRKAVDPAMQDVISPQEQFLTDKVEQANDKLKDIATGSKTTYSKGTGDEDGQFFKTTKGKREEITESRYKLESTERNASAAQNSQGNAQPLPNESSENASGEQEMASVGNNEETTNNKITNPQQNESKNDASEKGEEGEGKANAEKDDEENGKGQKDDVKVKSDAGKNVSDNYPYPKKLIDEMSSEELYDHAKEIKQHFKDQEVSFFGEEGAKEYQQAIAIEDSQFSSREKRDAARETIDKYENSLTPEQRRAWDAQPEFGNEDLRDLARHVNHIENAENVDELGGLIKNPLLDYAKDKNDKYNTAILTAAARRAQELGVDPANMLKTAIEKAVADLPGKKGEDLDGDKELITRSILNKIAKGAEPVIEQKGGTENATKEISQQESGGAEHQEGDESRTPSETGNRNSTERSAEGQGKEKPRYSIKGEKVTKLPVAEHVELNNILKSDHGITIQDLKDEHEERNTGGNQTSEVATNAETVQQPENDGTGNVGENRSGESPEGGKGSKSKTTFKKPPVTGVANADVEAERGESVDRTHKTKEQIETEGKRLVDSGELDPEKLSEDLIKNPRPVTAEEQSALRYHKAKLNNRQRALSKDSDANSDNKASNEVEYASNEDLIEQNRKATEIAGNETGRALGDRQQALAEDYSRVNVLRKAKIANGGELDPKDEAELTARTKRIEELEGKLADREEEIRKLQDKNTVSKVKRTADLEERNAKREVTKASLRKEREEILADLTLIAKKARSTLGANKIPVNMIVPLTKLARNYVLDGAITISQVADKVLNDVKNHIKGVTKEDIEDVIKNGFNDYLKEQNEVRLARSKKLQKTKLEKLKDENYEQKVFKKILVDNDYLNIRAEINLEQQRVNKKIADIENSKKSINRKIVDITVKYGRQAKLASVTVLGKLAATGLATMGIKPVTEGIGKGLSTILPRVAERSSVEGKVNRSELKEASKQTGGQAVNSLSQAYSRAFTIGMKDAYQELREGGSNLTALYKERGATLPAEAKEFFGHLHSAIKAPIKRFAWEHSYAKRVAKTIRTGLDPLDPVIDAQNRLNAYKDGEKAIFMGDNVLSKQYENVVGSMEKSNSSSARTAAAAMRILLPFVKVPTNIALEGAKYSFGSVSGLARLGRAFAKGMDNLTPEEADTILEHLKKGSIGGAAMLIGFYNPKNFGGFYQQGKKSAIKPGDIKLGDVDVPTFMVEHPLFIAAQVGANFRQLLDKYRHKDDRIPTATMATLAGLTYKVPQAEEIKRLVGLTENVTSMKEWEKFSAETLKGEVEPAGIQQLAKLIDPKQRQPDRKKGFIKYVGQTLETGIPGLSKNVPEKGSNKVKLLPKD